MDYRFYDSNEAARPGNTHAELIVPIDVHAKAKVFTWDCRNSIGACQNFCYYRNCQRGAKRQLTYDPNQANVDKRRKASGCSKNPCGKNSKLPWRKFGDSCDEFPFASTKEGGKGAQLRCVPRKENSSEGGQLSRFYKKLSNGEKFNVAIKNAGKANDGGQFQLNAGGKFVASKSKVAHPEFIPSTDEDLEPTEGPKEVRTDDGAIHLVIAEDPEDPVSEGSEVFYGDTGEIHRVVQVIAEH
ncbi:hypothetical protein VTO42DRAFT_5490 [Malbranchea cinnamomea]